MTLTGITVAVGDVPVTAMRHAVETVHKVAEIEAMRVAGPDRTLSGFGRRAKLTTKEAVKKGDASADAVIQAFPAGLWSIVTYGAAPHVIGFGRSRNGGNYEGATTASGGTVRKRLRQPGAGPQKFGSGWRMGPVFHPGTKPGKGSWTKVRKKSRPLVLKIFRDALGDALNG